MPKTPLTPHGRKTEATLRITSAHGRRLDKAEKRIIQIATYIGGRLKTDLTLLVSHAHQTDRRLKEYELRIASLEKRMRERGGA